VTQKSSLRDIYMHPVGRDVADKLKLSLLFRSGLPLGVLKLLGKSGLVYALPALTDGDGLPEDEVLPAKAWWKEAVFYQIRLRDFRGGLNGVAAKLDYLQSLGITALRLSPVYDTGDYFSVISEYGGAEALNALIAQLRWRGMRIVMDLTLEQADSQAIYAMMGWWLDLGIDGFKLDVMNYISKAHTLPDEDPYISRVMHNMGIEHQYFDARLHGHLRELRRGVFVPHGAFSLGEAPGVGLGGARMLSDAYREELDLLFTVHHFESFPRLKRRFMEQLNSDKGHGWHTLFFNNFAARLAAKVDAKGIYADRLAKLFAMLQLTLRGTPIVYQGDELGFENDDADSQELDATSVLSFYSDLIGIRNASPALVYGALTFPDARGGGFINYTRILSPLGDNFYIEANLQARARKSAAPGDAQFLMGNYGSAAAKLRPYEARIYKL